MFLFTTPATRETMPATTTASPVVSAIREGAERTGAGFDYLLKTAQRESALEPDAKARTSSATGLFQFIEQTWLAMVRQEGPRQGLGQYAGAISETDGGRLVVADQAMRDKILNLRKDPQIAAVMAGALTQKNGEQLGAALGRQPNAGELYIAHVLGARGASDLIRAVSSDPTRIAARDFPDAAGANRGIFFDKAGRARTVQEVYGVLAASHAGTQVAAVTTNAASQGAAATGAVSRDPVPIAAALAPGRAKGLIGLFSTEGSRAPVSQAVATLWSTPRSAQARATEGDAATRYFPGREGATTAAAGASEATAQSAGSPVQAPLPPPRPRDLAVADTSIATSTPIQARRRGPLDLSAFMTYGRRG